MKNKIGLFLGVLLAANANISFADLKIGVVNIPAILEKSPMVEKARKRMELEFEPRARQLSSQMKDIQSREEKMTRDGSVMSEAERSNLEKDIMNKKRDAKRSEQEYSEDLNARRNEELAKFQRRIVEAIQSIAKDQNYDLVLHDGVSYASDKIDVTSQVQQKLSTMPE